MNLRELNKPTEYDIPAESKHNAEIVKWIKDNLIEIQRLRNGHTSYGLKHYAEEDLGIYIKNGEFKYAMEEAGFHAYRTEHKNWSYAISKKSPAFNSRS